ncbi:hypothetical protein BDY21DRAFT_335496 [Lineolata rhizophorae]|uniref:Uncharacterized protein n=1 Tax=Lineolata rhizophorae TaxID=578093 RepID=A0A6A6P9I6_9PEZI|nr:hypothetical protein BDY21DRAFT_335496 [Lineolata rhizophorae]
MTVSSTPGNQPHRPSIQPGNSINFYVPSYTKYNTNAAWATYGLTGRTLGAASPLLCRELFLQHSPSLISESIDVDLLPLLRPKDDKNLFPFITNKAALTGKSFYLTPSALSLASFPLLHLLSCWKWVYSLPRQPMRQLITFYSHRPTTLKMR